MSPRAPVIEEVAVAGDPAASPAGVLRVTYRKSAIGCAHDQKATVAALGLRRLHQTVEHADTPALRGMIYKVRHLVSVDGIAADAPQRGGSSGPAASAEGQAEPSTRRQR